VKALWLLTGLLVAAALAGCGPDCDAYCNKVLQCQKEASPPVTPQIDVAQCVLGCNDSKSGHSDTINCYIDHTCADIAAGHCSVTGQPPK
jgi:hypothetical protein